METPSEDMKRCLKCQKIKPLKEFIPIHVRKTGKKYSENRCRECYNKYNREWRAKEGNRYKDKQRKRWHDRLNTMTVIERLEFNERMAKKVRTANKKLKDLVYDVYGDHCVCCGESEGSFLTIDHINNDGAEHRRLTGIKNGGTVFYRWLIRNDFPKDFQVLCWNCQWGKVKNNGICPHRVMCNDYPYMGVGSSDSKHSAPQEGDEIVCSA
jgi:hypothetical protein